MAELDVYWKPLIFTKRSKGKYLRLLYIQRPEIGGNLVLVNFFEREYSER